MVPTLVILPGEGSNSRLHSLISSLTFPSHFVAVFKYRLHWATKFCLFICCLPEALIYLYFITKLQYCFFSLLIQSSSVEGLSNSPFHPIGTTHRRMGQNFKDAGVWGRVTRLTQLRRWRGWGAAEVVSELLPTGLVFLRVIEHKESLLEASANISHLPPPPNC